MEGGAFAQAALDRQGSMVLQYNPAGDGESEAGSSLGTTPGLVDAVEALEDFRLLIIGNSDAAVLHGDDRVLALLFERQPYRAGRGSVFESVVEKNVDHAAQSGFVSQHRQLFSFDAGGELQIAHGSDLEPSFHDSVQNLRQHHRLQVEGFAA